MNREMQQMEWAGRSGLNVKRVERRFGVGGVLERRRQRLNATVPFAGGKAWGTFCTGAGSMQDTKAMWAFRLPKPRRRAFPYKYSPDRFVVPPRDDRLRAFRYNP